VDVLPDEQETLIQETAREFFAAESTPALVRAAEKDPGQYSAALWKKIADLGWLGISLPEDCGGQGLPLTYAGLLLEEAGRSIAPVPLHGTLVAALVTTWGCAGIVNDSTDPNLHGLRHRRTNTPACVLYLHAVGEVPRCRSQKG